MTQTTKKCRTAIFISGRGSNMQSLIEAARASSDYPVDFVLVLSNSPDAAGLHFAKEAGIQTAAIDHRTFGSKAEFEAAISAELKQHDVELICLAGFMRILSPEFAKDWEGRLINIHPSLLPAHKGLNTHQRALDAGDALHGCTVHYVTDGVDEGPTIAQSELAIHESDTVETLQDAVLGLEHELYPRALRAVASKMLGHE